MKKELLNKLNLSCGEKRKIEMTKKRKAFTNKGLDYTCRENLDTDKIDKFFNIA